MRPAATRTTTRFSPRQTIIGLIEDALEQDEEDTAEQPETEETSGPDEPDMEAEEE